MTTPVSTQAAAEVEVTYDEALRMAMGLHRDGRLDGAETLYRRLLQFQPDDPNVQHFLGMLLYQRQRLPERDEAIRLMVRSVMLDPNVAAWHNNLGNALLDAGEHEAAAGAYARCQSLDPSDVAAINNLGCLQRGLGQLAEAEANFQRALALDPRFADAHSNYATLLAQTNRLPDAFKHFAQALELKPDNPQARKLLGVVYAQTGQLDKAAQVFAEWVAEQPDNVQARHHLAAVTGQAVPDRAPDDYVVDVFDSFAASFDQRLGMLGYQAPRLVGELLPSLLGPAQGSLDIVDAGAGTGLCGPWLVPYARRLVGVDLSPGMLAKAEARGGYHALEASELVAWLQAHPASADLVVSADTLCYFGVLEAAFGAAHAALRPGGWLVFTVEAMAPAHAPAGYHLEPHGRYSHDPQYVQAALAKAGFASTIARPVELRREAGHAVNGWLVSARAGDQAATGAP